MSTHETTRLDDDSAAKSLGPDYLKQVWRRRRRLGLIVFGAALAATAGVVLSLPNLYHATANVLVERPQVSTAFVRSSVTDDLDMRIRTIHERLTSRERMSRLITRFNLYPNLRRVAPMDAAVDQMRRDVKLELEGVDQPNGGTETIAFRLSYTGNDPKIVADVANTLVDSYIAENVQAREKQAAGTAEVLEAQAKRAAQELDAIESRATSYTAQYGDQLAPQLMANMSAIDRAATGLLSNREAQRRAIEKRERIEAEMAAEASGRTASPDSPTGQMAKLKRDLAELKRAYKDEYPEVVRVKGEIADLERQIAAMPPENKTPNPALTEVDAELAMLKAQEAQLMKTEASYDQRIQATPTRQRELEELQQGRASATERYQAALKAYTDARLAASLEQTQRLEQFRVLDPAVPPLQPTAPDRPMLALIGLVLAIALALGAVFLAEKLDTSFHTADELSAFLDVPVLASIRHIPTKAGLRHRRVRGFFATCAALLLIALVGAGAFYLAAGNEQIVKLTARGGK
jgi:polysaccharide chain length determinant protein (PEP-CTERM system associated)